MSIRSRIMKWETPEAIDMRYGMEITMYISNR
jgi:coenzyme PQQ precursor peptide PqqA